MQIKIDARNQENKKEVEGEEDKILNATSGTAQRDGQVYGEVCGGYGERGLILDRDRHGHGADSLGKRFRTKWR